MTNFTTESAKNIVNELLDDIKENFQRPDNFSQIQLNTVKSINKTNLLQKDVLNNGEEKDETHLLSSLSIGSMPKTDDAFVPLILMNKQVELIHPLEHQWSFWYLKNQQGKDWQDNLMKLATFGYVEEFWALFNHLRVASRLPPSCDYMLFKNSILPCWEDPKNSGGGRWVLYFSKVEQMLALIGGQYAQDTDYVNGVVLSARKSCDRIALWTSVHHDQQLVFRIGRRMRELINIPRQIHILYELHNQETTVNALNKRKSTTSSNKVIYQL